MTDKTALVVSAHSADFVWRDLNGNGRLDPYEDPRLTAAERTADLLGRLSLDEKVGLLFHTVIEAGPGGTLLETPGALSKSPTSTVVRLSSLTFVAS